MHGAPMRLEDRSKKCASVLIYGEMVIACERERGHRGKHRGRRDEYLGMVTFAWGEEDEDLPHLGTGEAR